MDKTKRLDMESLIEAAVKALKKHYDFNEIELAEGDLKIKLVRNTPTPMMTYCPPAYNFPYSHY